MREDKLRPPSLSKSSFARSNSSVGTQKRVFRPSASYYTLLQDAKHDTEDVYWGAESLVTVGNSFPPLPPLPVLPQLPLFPPCTIPFLSPPSPSPEQQGTGSALAPPAGPGGARSPNTFWCNLQPNICKSVKVFHTCTWHPCNIFITLFLGCMLIVSGLVLLLQFIYQTETHMTDTDCYWNHFIAFKSWLTATHFIH